MSIDEMRTALLELVADETSPEYSSLIKALRSENAVLTEDRVTIGPWSCDRRKGVFVGSVVRPPAYLLEISGDFFRDDKGILHARVIKKIQS